MERKRSSSDGEDIPSDFFDDFNKDEFIAGLSVVDSWDEDKKVRSLRSRINAETLDAVNDLRELIEREDDDGVYDRRYVKPDAKYKWTKKSPHKSSSNPYHHDTGKLDDYIKPGSRRDPNKTNEAIRRDKEVKVKEHLAKHLESGSDLCPPGTELDDFFEEPKSLEVRKCLSETRQDVASPPKEYRPRHRYNGESPGRRRDSPPRYRRVRGALQRTRSPQRPYRPRIHYSPHRNLRKYPRYSPKRGSPVVRRERRSRSPYKRYRRMSRSRSPEPRPERDEHRRSRSRGSAHKPGRDDFLYPNEYYQPPEYSNAQPEIPYQGEPEPQYAKPVPVEYGDASAYPYSQSQAYAGYGAPYEYGAPSAQTMAPIPVPQPVPAPVFSSTATDPMLYNPTPLPMVHPTQTIGNQALVETPQEMQTTQVDALAKLVADGKLSHEDYLKLAPNKGAQTMDTNARVAVLNRCHNAISVLGTISIPNQLLINNSLIGPEQKQIAPKFCSPLKRQATTEFHFTKYDASAVTRQNKQIVNTIIATLKLEKIVGKPKKIQKDMKDVAVQTSKPFCDMCAVRESATFNNVGTSIDRDQLSSSIHTQVIEQDLVSSKSVFNPTGGFSGGANMSIAHMTPAQLVSQLAARAKTLKQGEPPSNQYRNSQSFDYDQSGGDHNYRNSYNYRY